MTIFSWLARRMGRSVTKAPASTGLLLGYTVGWRRKPVVLPDDVLRNHIAISGETGFSIPVLIEQLLQQQTQCGRGWLYLDTRGDDKVLGRMAAYARRFGREDEFHVLDLRSTGQLDLANIFASNEMCYIVLPLLDDPTYPAVAKALIHDICAAMEARDGVASQGHLPFLCVLEDCAGYALGHEAPLSNDVYARARALRVALALTMQPRWEALAKTSAGDLLLGNTFTKVYFKQPSEPVAAALREPRATLLERLPMGDCWVTTGTRLAQGTLVRALYVDWGPSGVVGEAELQPPVDAQQKGSTR